MIQTHKTLLYLSVISLFLQHVNGSRGAYSILLGKIEDGALIRAGPLIRGNTIFYL